MQRQGPRFAAAQAGPVPGRLSSLASRTAQPCRHVDEVEHLHQGCAAGVGKRNAVPPAHDDQPAAAMVIGVDQAVGQRLAQGGVNGRFVNAERDF